jgi:hypothetical protein
MEAVTPFEKTLAAAQDQIKTTLLNYQHAIQTDKQQEFEIKSTSDLVYQLIEGLTVEPTVKINSLIENIKKVTLNNL